MKNPLHGSRNPPRRRGWMVGGRWHRNSAAQFWAGFIETTLSTHPGCTDVELSATLQGRLCREALYPERSLEITAEQLRSEDLHKAWRELLAELEVMGPPSPVIVRVLENGRELAAASALSEDINAEIFVYLLAWILEWAGIPEALWNGPGCEGSFDAVTGDGRTKRTIRFEVSRQPLSEGLDRTVLRIAMPA